MTAPNPVRICLLRLLKNAALAVLVAVAGGKVGATQVVVDVAKPATVSKAGDDVAQIKRLALSVGTEFSSSRITEAHLESLGIQTLRLINVGISARFDDDGNFVDIQPSPRLEQDLALCRRIGANPHVVISGLPAPLLKSVPLKITRHRALGIDIQNRRQFIGPTDYQLLENWYLAYFEYIKITQGFKDAVFEIFNEPDLGTLIYPTDDIPPKGSPAAYDCMLKIYRAASAAGKRFDAKHPECKLKLGGISALAFTYKLGREGSWAHKFIADCGREKLKLDFLSVHNYASVAPFRGEIRPDLTNYPSFPDMLASLRESVSEHLPGLPVWVTEYGPHHNVSGTNGEINGNHDGAAFALDCLTAMLELGIDSAIYLVTTDLHRISKEDGDLLLSWCSFLTDPSDFGYPYPKAPYHAYKMIAELEGSRVEATSVQGNVRTFAAYDVKGSTLRVLLWNYATYIPEGKPIVQEGKVERVSLSIRNLDAPQNAKAVLRSVDREQGDVVSAYRDKRAVDLAAASPRVARLNVPQDKTPTFDLTMQPGSIAMLEIGPDPAEPSLKTPYAEKAEVFLKTMRDDRSLNPSNALETGRSLLALDDLHEEQKLDGLKLLTEIAQQMNMQDEALRYAVETESLCNAMNRPLPCGTARQFGHSERAQGRFDAAVVRYRQALAAPDCDWRTRFGTRLAIIDCLNAQRKYTDVVAFCDSVLAANDDMPSRLHGDFLLRKMEALRNLGDENAMLESYRQLLESNSEGNAKISGIMAIVNYHAARRNDELALSEGRRRLDVQGAQPALLNKLEALLKAIENKKTNIK